VLHMSRQRRSLRAVVARSTAVVVLAAAFVAPASASAGVLDSLSGWWPMYEGGGQTVHDLSGNGNSGQLGSTPGADANDPSWIRGFLFGSALRFDGNDFVRIPDAPALRPTTMTVSAWVRAAQTPGAFKYVIGKGANECLESSYSLYTGSNGGLRFYIWDKNTNSPRLSGAVDPAAIWNGKWHHIAGTWDGRDARLFLDGKLVASPGSASGPADVDYFQLPTTGNTGIGGYLGPCDLFYTGDIDDLTLFNQALPVDQIWSKISALFSRPMR
jgi:hypothetical protein